MRTQLSHVGQNSIWWTWNEWINKFKGAPWRWIPCKRVLHCILQATFTVLYMPKNSRKKNRFKYTRWNQGANKTAHKKAQAWWNGFPFKTHLVSHKERSHCLDTTWKNRITFASNKKSFSSGRLSPNAWAREPRIKTTYTSVLRLLHIISASNQCLNIWVHQNGHSTSVKQHKRTTDKL